MPLPRLYQRGEGFSKNLAKHTKRVCRKYSGLTLTGYVTKSWGEGQIQRPLHARYHAGFRPGHGHHGMLRQLEQHEQSPCRSEEVCQIQTAHHLYDPHVTRLSAGSQPVLDFHHADARSGGVQGLSRRHSRCDPEERRIHEPPPRHRQDVCTLAGGSIGHNEYEVFRTLKEHFDPDGIMNPGGTLGFDLTEEEDQQRAKLYE